MNTSQNKKLDKTLQSEAQPAVNSTGRGRPAILGPALTKRLRKRITGGKWKPGVRLPTRRELCKELNCSTITLQVAMDTLSDEGFIWSDRRRGTFVSDQPPHLSDLALIFPPTRARNQFFEAIASSAAQWNAAPYRIHTWRDVEPYADNSAYLKLRERVINKSLTGIFFVSSPHRFLKSPLLTQPDIARVTVGNDWLYPEYPVSLINLRRESFAERALARLRVEGCRRLAVVSHPADNYDFWQEIATSAGFNLPPHLFQRVSQLTPDTATDLARLLFYRGQAELPDGVIITDDNLVECFTRGMLEAGCSQSGHTRIIAHCNFPWPTHSLLPVIRLGMDTYQILATARTLTRQYQATSQPGKAVLEAVFAEEALQP